VFLVFVIVNLVQAQITPHCQSVIEANGVPKDAKWAKPLDQLEAYQAGRKLIPTCQPCQAFLSRPEKKITLEEASWIYAYALELYQPINCYMANPGLPQQPAWVAPALTNMASGADKLSEGTNADIFRGTRLTVAPARDGYVRNRSYLSTTTLPDVAARFGEDLITKSPQVDAYVIWFRNPGLATATISHFTKAGAAEAEKVIKPDNCWKVVGLTPTTELKGKTNPFKYWDPSKATNKNGLPKLTMVELEPADKAECNKRGSASTNILSIDGDSVDSLVEVDAMEEIDNLESQIQELDELIE